ncbi:MAG: histidinol dehydrogenase, partial [Spongiibacter sp.]
MPEPLMARLSSRQADFDSLLDALLAWDSVSDDAVASTVQHVLADVKERGDAALLEYTRQFDALDVSAMAELEFSQEQLLAALTRIDAAQREALENAAARIRHYHEKQVQQSWSYTEA